MEVVNTDHGNVSFRMKLTAGVTSQSIVPALTVAALPLSSLAVNVSRLTTR